MKVTTGFAWAALLTTVWACGSSDADPPYAGMTMGPGTTTATGGASTGTSNLTTGGTTTSSTVTSTTMSSSTSTGATMTSGTASATTTGGQTTGAGTGGASSAAGVGGAASEGTGQNLSTTTGSGMGGGTNAGTMTDGAQSTSNSSTTGGMEGCESGPLDAPIPNCSPEPVPDTGDYYADCVARINQFRWECQCLPPLERWVEAEDCADQQAEYDYEQDSPHQGIRDNICQPGGGAQNECPDYGPNFGIVDFCLQQMWDEGPGEDFNAHGHYLNMSNTSFSRVACGMYVTPEGNTWAVQNFD